jgi:hypothetical protein
MGTKADPETIADMEVYGLWTKTIEMLDRHGIIYLHQLQRLRAIEFLQWESIGPGMLRNLRDALCNYSTGRPTKSVADCTEFGRRGGI